MVVDLAAVSLAKACDVGSLGASHGFLLPPLLRFRSHGCRGFRFGRTGLIFLSQLEQCLGGVLVQYCACQSAVAFRLLPEELCPLIDHCHSTAAVARSAAKAPPLRACGREQCGAVSVGGKPPIRARSFFGAQQRGPSLQYAAAASLSFSGLHRRTLKAEETADYRRPRERYDPRTNPTPPRPHRSRTRALRGTTNRRCNNRRSPERPHNGREGPTEGGNPLSLWP